MRRKNRAREKLGDGVGNTLRRVRSPDQLPKLPYRLGIGQSAMANGCRQPMPLDQRIQIVELELGIKLAREHHRAQGLGIKLVSCALEFGLQKRNVEARV